jgi:NTE family protein
MVTMKTKKKIGLALGSGVAKGIAHIGVLKVLSAHQIPIDYIAGSSIGALIGALYASGLSIEQMEEVACNIDWKLTAKLFAPTLPYSGLVEGKRIRQFISSLIGDKNFEDTIVPFAAVTTDMLTGEEFTIKSGSLIEAVRASISIPGIFTPVQYQNRLLVDGGVVNPVPVDVTREMGADIVIAINVMSSLNAKAKNIILPDETSLQKIRHATTSTILNSRLTELVKNKIDLSNVISAVENWEKKKELLEKKFHSPNIFETVMQTFSIIENNIIEMRFRQYPPDILIKPAIENFGLMEFYKANEFIKVGEAATEAVIPLIQRLIS